MQSRSTFLKQVGILTSGSALAQLIPFAVAPILARIYAPELYGEFYLYSSWLATIALVSSARLDVAIIVEEKDNQIPQLRFVSQLLPLLFSAITAVLGFIFSIPWLLWVAVSVIGFQVNWVNLQLLIRQKRYKAVFFVRVITALCIAIFSFLFSYINGPNGLIMGSVIGYLIGGVLSSTKLIRQFKREGIIQAIQWKTLVQDYKGYIGYNSFHAVIGTSVDPIIFLGVTHYFGAAILGQLAMAFRLLRAPTGMIGGSIGQSFISDASEAKRQFKPMYPHILRTMKLCLILGLLGFTPLYFFGEEIVILILGNTWELSGNILEKFTLAFFLGFLLSPISSLYLLIQKQNEGLIMGISSAVIRLSGLIVLPYCVTNSELATVFMVLYTLSYINDATWYIKWIKDIRHYDSIVSSSGSSL